MLYAKAGLKDDPDTYHFLCGTLYRSSTYTSYESHTEAAAMLRLYQILKPVSTEKRLEKTSGYRTDGQENLYVAWPKTNHEVSRIMGKIRLSPGQKMVIRCSHGATGMIRIARGGD